MLHGKRVRSFCQQCGTPVEKTVQEILSVDDVLLMTATMCETVSSRGGSASRSFMKKLRLRRNQACYAEAPVPVRT
jgi:hypothetical protein